MLTAVIILLVAQSLVIVAAVGAVTEKIDEVVRRIDQIWDTYIDDTIDLLLEQEGDDEQ